MYFNRINTDKPGDKPNGLELVVIPAQRGRFLSDGTVQVGERLMAVVEQYAKLWPGPVSVLLGAESSELPAENVVVDPADLPFGLFEAQLGDERAMAASLVDAAVVLAGLEEAQVGVAEICRRLGVPCVYDAELTLGERKARIKAEVREPFGRLRRYLQAGRREAKLVGAVKGAAGVQCAGVGALKAYGAPAGMVYFESRLERKMLAASGTLRDRTDSLLEGHPLRLGYWGDLTRKHGAHHLAGIATALRQMRVEFTLDVFGEGECWPALRKQLIRDGLDGRVILHREVEGVEEMMGRISESVDLMVLPFMGMGWERVYLESLGAGVPVAAYGNEGWDGFLAAASVGAGGAEVGVSVKASKWGMATAIRDLNADRVGLAAMASAGRAFAARHTVEKTAARRVDHLLLLSRMAGRRTAAKVEQQVPKLRTEVHSH